ncbi:MAG: hypothetical protein KF778_05365 [Rhodocyclaceae bacterium]|nr:hypothetical protein [Rhodocyclaceae bacterium]MBX3667811.1 hypothetical protein [Rhodocyclaceae bacterium]
MHVQSEALDSRLEDFLAPGRVAEDLPALFPLLAARPLLAACTALFHGGEAAVLARLLVLRELAARAAAPRWSRREMSAHFAYLDPTKLDTIIKRLADFALLDWDAEDRSYRVSPLGHQVAAAVASLLQFSGGDEHGLGFLTAQLAGGAAAGRTSVEHLQQVLGRLTELEEQFAAAVRSGSEIQLKTAQSRLESVFLWMEKGTQVLHQILEAGELDDAGYRVAQEIGQRQSRLMRMAGVFSRELAAMARQHVHLARGGLSTAELARWLQGLGQRELAELAQGALSTVPEPAFVTPDVMLDVAEYELCERAAQGRPDDTLPAAAGADPTLHSAGKVPPQLSALIHLLSGLEAPLAVADAVVADDYPRTAYRFSLLPLIGEQTADPTLQELAALGLRVAQNGPGMVAVERAGVAKIDDFTLEPARG